MASYSIEVSATAEKQIRRLGSSDRLRVLRAIQQLSHNPRPRGCRKLQGYDDVFRMRIGTHRVIYSIETRRLLIIILKVGHRKDVYR
ncbi:MAG: type II toxin-antitoxin system RelE/ParE family toxin [Gammaproteobacteria bacterium]|nr:type II toxin-antitoxin system RelE/ParE family toxin [Gammaproteobacteria bacterium]